jgi:TonB family protein
VKKLNSLFVYNTNQTILDFGKWIYPMKKMKDSLLLIFMLFAVNIYAQEVTSDTLFYGEGKQVSTPDSADVFKIVLFFDANRQKVFERIFTIEGVPIEETHYSDFTTNQIDLYHREYYLNRKTYRYIGYSKGMYHGKFQVFYPTGIKRREDLYEEGRFVKGKCYDTAGNEIRYIPYNSSASFIEGDNELRERIQIELGRTLYGAGDKLGYKGIADASIAGRVVVCFVIDKQGVMKNVRVVKTPNPEINDKVVNAIIRIRGWQPASKEGEYVDSEITMPISIFMN